MTVSKESAFEIKTDSIPEISGLNFRGFQGEADIPIMLKIIEISRSVDQIEEVESLEDLSSQYLNPQRFDPHTDMIFAEINGEAVGFGRCKWNQESNGDFIYPTIIELIPKWRGKSIGLTLGQHLHARIQEISQQHPDHAAQYIHVWSSDTQDWLNGLIDQLDLRPVRFTFQMSRSCSQPVVLYPLPSGIEVRHATPEDYREILAADSEACQDHWGFVTPTEKDYQRWLKQPTFDPAIWKVAWEGDQVVGMVLNFVNHKENEKFNRKRGYTEDISVRLPWQRQGIARSLLTQSIQMFQELGMEETCLGVDTDNASGALKLYESVGYQEIKRYVAYRKKIT